MGEMKTLLKYFLLAFLFMGSAADRLLANPETSGFFCSHIHYKQTLPESGEQEFFLLLSPESSQSKKTAHHFDKLILVAENDNDDDEENEDKYNILKKYPAGSAETPANVFYISLPFPIVYKNDLVQNYFADFSHASKCVLFCVFRI
jgi:hypothetical protein